VASTIHGVTLVLGGAAAAAPTTCAITFPCAGVAPAVAPAVDVGALVQDLAPVASVTTFAFARASRIGPHVYHWLAFRVASRRIRHERRVVA
jgi:hypothetical protein